MIRKWPYLIKSEFSLGDTSIYKRDIFSWYKFKTFKRSVKFRKKRAALGYFTKLKKKRRYTSKQRRKKFFFNVFIFKDWSKHMQKTKQFWRFYQMNGILNTNALSFEPTVLKKLIDTSSQQPSLYVSTIKGSILNLMIANNVYVHNKSYLKLNRNATILIDNSQLTYSNTTDPLLQTKLSIVNYESLYFANIDSSKVTLVSNHMNLITDLLSWKLTLTHITEIYKILIKLTLLRLN